METTGYRLLDGLSMMTACQIESPRRHSKASSTGARVDPRHRMGYTPRRPAKDKYITRLQTHRVHSPRVVSVRAPVFEIAIVAQADRHHRPALANMAAIPRLIYIHMPSDPGRLLQVIIEDARLRVQSR